MYKESLSENIEVMNNRSAKYIPAVSFDWLTPLYDPIMQVFMPEKAFKRCLVEQMRIEKGHRVLDLGCGTATLAILIKKAHPDAEIVGLDGDQKILEIARTKIENERLALKEPASSACRSISQ
jgi:ubiquinone/menaquinone biosynthesis C-methylase UbiE